MSPFRPDFDLIHGRLAEIDLVAASNVISELGGPFSATVLFLSREGKGPCDYHVVASLPVTTNKVLETGRASAHAEDQSLTPDSIRKMREILRAFARGKPDADLQVVFLSSAQPCMACLSKLEICARSFIQEGLLKPRAFSLVYGAPYAETEDVAHFYDYIYAVDFVHASKSRRNPNLMVSLLRVSGEEIPENVRAPLFATESPRAVLLRNGEVLAIGNDRREKAGLFATAECSALHAASRHLRERANDTPWDIHGSLLFTRTIDVGPLLYAEAQWAGIGMIVSVPAPDNGVDYQQTQECSAIENGALFEAVAGGYNTAQSALVVYRDTFHDNLAQETWWLKQDRTVYNGAKPRVPVGRDDKVAFDAAFNPYPLLACPFLPSLAQKCWLPFSGF